MDACDPGVNSEDLKTHLKQKLGIDLKLSRNEICDVYSSIQDGKLPLPPLVLSRDRTHMMDRKSPLTMSDFDKLFSSSTKVTSIRRIAKKVGVARHADKKLTKAQLIGIIGRRLHALKVYEPIKFYSNQKTKIIRESINSFDNERNENNVNRGGRRNNNERNENNVNRSGRRNNNERNENNVNRGDRRNNNERNENRSPKFSKKRPFFLKRTSGPYVNVEKNAIKTQFNKLNRALFGEKTNDEQDEFERLSKIRRVVRRGKEKFKEQIEKDGYSNLTNREFDKYWEYLMKISKKRVYNEITGFIPSSKIMPWGLFKRTPPSSKKTPETGVSSYKNTPESGNSNNVKNTLNTSVSTSVKKTKKISKNNTNNVKKQLFNNRYNQAENLKNKYREYLRDKSVVRIIRNYQNNTKTGFFGKSKFPTLNNANKAIQNRINIIKISNSVRNQFNNDKNRNIVNRVLNNLETGKSGLKTEVQVIGKINELLTQKNQNEPAKINAKNTPETGNSNNVKNTLNTSVSTSVKKTKKISKNNTNNVKKQLFNNRYNQAENLKNKYREYLRDKSVVRIIRNYQNNTKTGFFGKRKFPTLNNANKAIQNRINIIKISNSVRNQFNNDKNRNIVNRVLNNLETGKSGLKTEVQVIVKINELLTQKKQTEAAKINAQRKAEENAKKKNEAEAAKANAQRRKNEAAIGKAIFKQKKIETETEIQRIKNETVTKIYRGYSTELNNVSNLNQLENIHRRYKKSKISKVLKQKLNKKYKNKKLELNSNSTRKRSSGGIFGSLFGKKRKNKNNSNNNIYYNNTSNETDEKNTLNEKIQRTRNKFKRTRNKFQDTGRKIGKIFFKKEKKEKVPNKTEIRVEGRDGQAVYLRLIREVREVENSEQQLKALRREGILRLHPNKNPGFNKQYLILFKSKVDKLLEEFQKREPEPNKKRLKQRSSLEKLLKSSKNLTDRNKYFRRLEGGESLNSVRRNAIKEIRSLAEDRRRKEAKAEADSQKSRSSLEKLLKSSKNLTDRNKYFRRLEGGESLNSVRRNAIKEIRSLAEDRRRKEAKAEVDSQKQRSSLEKLLKSSKNLTDRNKYFRRLEGGESLNSVRRNAIKEIRSLAEDRRRKEAKAEADSQKQRSSLEKLLKSSKNLTNRNKYFRRLEGGENLDSVRRNAIKEIRSLAEARRRKAVKTEVDSQKSRSSLEKLLKSSKNLTNRNKYFRRLEGGESLNSVRRNAIKEIRSLAEDRRRKENNAKAKAEAEAKARRRKENNAKDKAEAESRKKKEYNNKMKIKRQMELKKQKNVNNTKNRENERRLELKKQMEAKAIEASKKAQAAKDEIIAKRKVQELEKRKAQELEKRKRDTFKRQIQSSYLTSNEKSSYIKQVNTVANFKPLVKKIKSAMLKASEDAKKKIGKASLLEQMYGEKKDNMRKQAELNAKKRKEARVKIKQYMKKTYPSMSDRDRKMYANRIKNTEWKMLGGYIHGTRGMSASEAYDRVKRNINRNWKGKNVKLESKKREIDRKIKKRDEKIRRRGARKR